MVTRPARSRQWSVNHNFIVKVSIWITYDNIDIIIGIKSVYKANAIVFPQPQVCNLEAALVKAFTSFPRLSLHFYENYESLYNGNIKRLRGAEMKQRDIQLLR